MNAGAPVEYRPRPGADAGRRTADVAPRQPTTILDFTPVYRNTLRGFAKVLLPSGLIFIDVAIHVGNDGRAWASPASKPMIDRNGCAIRDDDGKIKYSPTIDFANKRLRDLFSDVVVEALRQARPDAFR